MRIEDALILTLKFDEETFERLDGLRRAHFPPERNLIPAHLTLFHQLPHADGLNVVRSVARERQTRAFGLAFTGLRFLGRGVAITVSSQNPLDLRDALARASTDALTPQDAQKFRPHVTIQNKVSAEIARALHTHLSAGFVPWMGTATGLTLWRYLGGPWRLEAEIAFA